MKQSAPLPDPPTVEERLQAMEFFLGQALLTLEADSCAIWDKIEQLETAISGRPPKGATLAAEDAEHAQDRFTMDSLGAWMQLCARQMREHQAATARQLVAIGELTDRVLSLGEHLAQEEPPEAGPVLRAALARANRRPPPD